MEHYSKTELCALGLCGLFLAYFEWTSDSSLIIWSKIHFTSCRKVRCLPRSYTSSSTPCYLSPPLHVRENRKLSLRMQSPSNHSSYDNEVSIIYYPFNPSLTLSGFTTSFSVWYQNHNNQKPNKMHQMLLTMASWFWSSLWWKLSVGSHTALPLLSNET